MEWRRLVALTAADLMSGAVTLASLRSIREAAISLACAEAPIAIVVPPDGTYEGVFAEPDIHHRLIGAIPGFHSPTEFRTGVPFLGGQLPDPLWRQFARVGSLSVGALTPRVPGISPEDKFEVALEAVREEGLSAMPVVTDGEIVGMLRADTLSRRRDRV